MTALTNDRANGFLNRSLVRSTGRSDLTITLLELDGFLEMDDSIDDDIDSVVEDMSYGEGPGIEHVFDDEFIEYDDYYVLNGLSTKKARYSMKRTNYWDVGWGKMLREPELQNPCSRQAKKLRVNHP